MKKILLSILLLSLLIGSVYADGAKIEMTDVGDHWGKEYINYMVDNEISVGYPDRTFRPNNTISVDEFLVLCIKSLPNVNIAKAPSGTYWAKPFIDYGLANGLIDGSYQNYQRAITREEMAHISISTLGKMETLALASGGEIQEAIKDYATINDNLKDDVVKSYSAGLFSGNPDKTFLPQNTASRAEASVVITRLNDESYRDAFEFSVDYVLVPTNGIDNNGQSELQWLKLLAPYDSEQIERREVIDLFNHGLKVLETNDATVQDKTINGLAISNQYSTFNQLFSTLFTREGDIGIDVAISANLFMFELREYPYAMTFYEVADYSFYETKYNQYLDWYYEYFFGSEKAKMVNEIKKVFTQIRNTSDDDVSLTYNLENNRKIRIGSSGSSVTIYIGNGDVDQNMVTTAIASIIEEVVDVVVEPVVEEVIVVDNTLPLTIEDPIIVKYGAPSNGTWSLVDYKMVAPVDENGVQRDAIIKLYNYGREIMNVGESLQTTAEVGDLSIGTSFNLGDTTPDTYDDLLVKTTITRTDASLGSIDIFVTSTMYDFKNQQYPHKIELFSINEYNYYDSSYSEYLNWYYELFFEEEMQSVRTQIEKALNDTVNGIDTDVRKTIHLKNGRTVFINSTGGITIEISNK